MCSLCRIMFWPFCASRRHTSGFKNLIPHRSKVRCPLISPFMEKPVHPSGNQSNTWTGFVFNTTYSTCNERQGTKKRNWRIFWFFFFVKGKYWCPSLFGTFSWLSCYVTLLYILLCSAEITRGSVLPGFQPRDARREKLLSAAWLSLVGHWRLFSMTSGSAGGALLVRRLIRLVVITC